MTTNTVKFWHRVFSAMYLLTDDIDMYLYSLLGVTAHYKAHLRWNEKIKSL